MTPEEKARQEIDEHLQLGGWIVQDRDEMNIFVGLGVAIREFPLAVGEADYLLHVSGVDRQDALKADEAEGVSPHA